MARPTLQLVAPNWRSGDSVGRPRPSDEWLTPPAFYRALDREFRFALDAACTTENCLAPRGLCVDRGEDALAHPWPTDGPVWCNPPYSKIAPWLGRGREAAAVAPVVFLLPVDKTTRSGGGTQPSAVVVYRPSGGPPRYTYMPATPTGY